MTCTRVDSNWRRGLAEGEGFEPPVAFTTAVFKTAAINRTRPSLRVRCQRIPRERSRQTIENHLTRNGGGDLAGRVAADTVDDGEDAASGIADGQIFIVRAHAARVAARRGRKRPRRHARHRPCSRANQAIQNTAVTSRSRNGMRAQYNQITRGPRRGIE